MKRTVFASIALVPLLAACSEDVGDGPSTTTVTGAGSSTGAGAGGGETSGGGGSPGVPLSVPVPATGRVFVKLDPPAIATPPGDGKTSSDWDLAFEGFDVYTNSGASGPAKGGAFGPLSAIDFRGDTAPEVPFLVQDTLGGAFKGWYVYDGSTHSLYSRYHLYGVRDGDKLWKVQVLGYYGELQGAPVSALYQIRYAEVLKGDLGATMTLKDINAWAGGTNAPQTAPSGCVDLGTGAKLDLTPAEAIASSAWHLCFRRDKISVNGGLGGPRGVVAIDLQASQTASEEVDKIKAKTAASEHAAFDAVSFATLSDPKLAYNGDRVLSAFTGHWLDPAKSPAAPASAAWLAVAADGVSKHRLEFVRFDGATSASPGTVELTVKLVK